ncbi:tripartite tricarboxylate transporter substrate binding protein [Acuticoccus sp. MNP-M23]|uniref:Bug family tripartite tricarboxylate transporter substrate binding protein n=1 Tax=Acuticoccus sp. MNP-M23 TaxID=3072793 RepID=UPI002814B2DD|nr:tripartite tricarboxylate transporter substrate binding protein [Acuticoccus sp. MNP-M23]WMS43665.1 tripartite tricarboxylate transporter substrate binding protein [Acuticoccus sp. MNP-M23]
MKFVVKTALAAALMLGTSGGAMAEWPEKPVKVVVPFGAGGTSDQITRAFAAAIEENDLLPEPITVINVGGHYSVGARQVMEANADGYTFLTLHIALMGGEGGGVFDFGYRDYKPVATTGEFCVIPMVRKDSGIDSVEQLLEKAKAEPDTLIFGANLGAINHMGGVMLQNLVDGAKFRFVQIGGGTANYTALTGAQTAATVLSAAEVANFTMGPDGKPLEDAQIKPLAYTGAERVKHLPDLPTMKELGYDMNYCIQSWWFAPKDTPQEAVDGMANALEAAMGTERIEKFFDSKMFAPVFLKGEAMQASLDETWEKIEPIAKQASKK